MSEKTGIHIDFSEFNRLFKDIVKHEIPELAGDGLFQAGNALLKDARTVQPYVPVNKKVLTRSGMVEHAKITQGKIDVTLGFTSEYAARWHELTPAEDARINWTLPGSGRKYLESKMARFMNKYVKIASDYILNRSKT